MQVRCGKSQDLEPRLPATKACFIFLIYWCPTHSFEIPHACALRMASHQNTYSL